MPALKSGIIEVIQEMVRNGESEEKIIKNLQELGVDREQAKKLLLLGEADTFALLQSEINKIVKRYVEEEKPRMAVFIREEVRGISDKMTENVEKRALNAFKEDQRFIENQAAVFQARVNQSVKNILELNEETKKSIAEIRKRLSITERAVWEMKDRVLGSKGIDTASKILVALEIGLVGATAYLAFAMGKEASIDLMVAAAAIAAVLATMAIIIRRRL
ncbi:MAG: hypothetical protein JW744_02460 [Candidatus Diapherotrites archaeon]|uniref:Uncharacterized protein n=1 Tax=Candidatus Iainarchaeum sp. TaxID=3101447 RepID=A0A938YWV4_9ARCH|nr:hypothetical protein [Candidatus Diapherotrites archaeon]